MRREEKERNQGKGFRNQSLNKSWVKNHCRSSQNWNGGSKLNVPSKSSMVFSSLATVLSANSARVSAFEKKNKNKLNHQDKLSLVSFWGQSLSRKWTYLLKSVIQDFNLLLIFVFFLRVLQRQRKQLRKIVPLPKHLNLQCFYLWKLVIPPSHAQYLGCKSWY